MDAIRQWVLPGSGVRIQWRDHDSSWRCLTVAGPRDSFALVGWRPWAGRPTEVAKVGVAHDHQRWWVAAGELPSGGSTVVVETDGGMRPRVEHLEGRLWYCEWSGPPSVASVTVDGGAPVTLDFRRRAHYLPGERSGRI